MITQTSLDLKILFIHRQISIPIAFCSSKCLDKKNSKHSKCIFIGPVLGKICIIYFTCFSQRQRRISFYPKSISRHEEGGITTFTFACMGNKFLMIVEKFPNKIFNNEGQRTCCMKKIKEAHKNFLSVLVCSQTK